MSIALNFLTDTVRTEITYHFICRLLGEVTDILTKIIAGWYRFNARKLKIL